MQLNLQPADASSAMQKSLRQDLFYFQALEKRVSRSWQRTRDPQPATTFVFCPLRKKLCKVLDRFPHSFADCLQAVFFSSLPPSSQVFLLLSSAAGTFKSRTHDCVDILFRFCHLLKLFARNEHGTVNISMLPVLRPLPVSSCGFITVVRKIKAIFLNFMFAFCQEWLFSFSLITCKKIFCAVQT